MIKMRTISSKYVSGIYNAVYILPRALYTNLKQSFIYFVATCNIEENKYVNNNINPKPSTSNMDGNIPIIYVYS